MRLRRLVSETTWMLVCVQSIFGMNPLRTLFASESKESMMNIPSGIVSPDGRVKMRNPRVLDVAVSDFAPLSCTNVTEWVCEEWPYGASADFAEVPCNVCYTMGKYTNGETIVVNGPVNIQGKLDFPDGTKVTLEATAIIVQGELSMRSSKVVDGSPDITIRLNGETDVGLFPNAPNTNACGEQGCNLGPKALVVAGGRVSISGLPDNCPTWTTVVDIISGDTPVPLYYAQRPQLSDECSDPLIEEDFESGRNKWYGNVGAQESIEQHADGSGSYLHVTRRTHSYQGPMVDLPRLTRTCVMTEQDYFFSARVRISPGAEYGGSHSQCHLTRTNCPKLQYNHMDKANSVRWRELVTNENATIQDDTWFVMEKAFRIPFSFMPISYDDVYGLFTVNGVEAGIDIDIDDVSIRLPPAEAYPDPSNVCGDLVVNGDAELGSFPFPIRPYIQGSSVWVKQDELVTGNHYFSVTGRTAKFDSVAVDINPECLVPSSTFTFSARYRLHSVLADAPVVKLISTVPGVSGIVIDVVVVGVCPASSIELGWQSCESTFAMGGHLRTASNVQLLVMYGVNELDDADFDDISLRFEDSTQEGDIELGDYLGTCYAAGAKVLVPSDNLLFDAAQVATLNHTASGYGNFVSVEEALTRVSTYNNDADFAAELAVLSRNILFENGSGDDDDIRPSFVVYHTPDVGQLIQGVDFNGFGRVSAVNGFPITLLSSPSAATRITKNTIRHSKHGCIHMATTSDTVISDNVAYNTVGNCYELLSGTSNHFSHNLGAVTRLNPVGGESATFYIGHPDNKYSSNVAGGSERTGFYLAPHESDLGGFEDNVAHSNSLYGIKSLHKPLAADANSWINTRVYRNVHQGILFRNARNTVLSGGVVADNRVGIDVWVADNVAIDGIKVMGDSKAFRSLAEKVPSVLTQCYSPLILVGLRIHVNKMDTDAGTKIHNVAFTDFVEGTGCSEVSTAIKFHGPDADPLAFTTSVHVSATQFDAAATPIDMISLCETFTYNILDVTVVDDGSLNPIDSIPGIVVSNSAPTLPDDVANCSPMAGSCAMYCPLLDPEAFEDEAIIDQLNDQPYDADPPPQGGIVNAPLTDNNDSYYDYYYYDQQTDQAHDAGCILNGDFTIGLSSWTGALATVALVSPGYGGVGSALKATARQHQVRAGPAQDIPTACLLAGHWYEVSLHVKLTNAGSDSVFVCNPTDMYYDDDNCAGVHFLIAGDIKQIAYTAPPVSNQPGAWSQIYGIFQASPDIMAHSTIQLIVSRAQIDADITIDNLEIAHADPLTIGNCTRPLINGDAEIGDARGWWIRGHGTNGHIEMGSPGYNNSQYAFKHIGNRDNKIYSMLQKIDGACFTDGSTWKITAQFRFFDTDGYFADCDKGNVNLVNSCPVFAMFAGSIQTGGLRNKDDSPVNVGGWNLIHNEFTIDASMAAQDEVWINVQAGTDYNYELDDIELVPI